MTRRPTGGKGSNQYATKGAPTAMSRAAYDELREIEAAAWAFTDMEARDQKEDRSAAVRQRSAVKQARWSVHPDPSVRAMSAASGSATVEVLTALSRDSEPSVRAAVAGNKDTPPKLLRRLAADRDLSTARTALRNPACPPAVLRKSEHTQAVAENPACPPDLLAHIARTEPDAAVLMSVADNKACPPEVLQDLILHWQDSQNCFFVADSALYNKACPPEALTRFVEEHTGTPTARIHDHTDEMLVSVAGNPVCPPETLRVLADLQDAAISKAVAGNRSCPPELLDYMSRMPKLQADVRVAIIRNPRSPASAVDRAGMGSNSATVVDAYRSWRAKNRQAEMRF